MGVLQKAYTFVKKHWSTDDDVYPNDLNRYEDGIDELYNRATEQDKQINGLLSMLDKLQVQKITSGTHTLSDYKEQGIYCFSSATTITDIPVGSNGWLIVLPSTTPNATKQLWLRWGSEPNFHQTFVRYISYDDIYEWREYGTTTKTDISLLNGWTVYVGEVNAVKIGNLVTIPDVRLKGGIGTKGTILFNLPQGFRPPKTRHVMTIKNGTTPTLLTVGSNGNVAILYDDFVGASDISYTVGFSFLTE